MCFFFFKMITFIKATFPFPFELFFWAFGLFLMALAALVTVFKGFLWNLTFIGSFVRHSSAPPCLSSTISVSLLS